MVIKTYTRTCLLW